MTKAPPRALDYVRHIVEAIDNVMTYTAEMSFEQFEASAITRDAVIRNIEIVGEAASQLRNKYPEWLEAHPALPWAAMIGMRNRIVHGYFSVNLEVVWNTIQTELSPLRIKALALLKTEG